MLTLHIIRHAKTEQLAAGSSVSDKNRKLTEKGIAQSNLLGHYLQDHNLALGTILCSSATRARQTKSVICQHLPEKCQVEFYDSLYLASKATLLEAIAAEKESVLTLIGHNDGLSDLVSYCTDEFITLKTCEYITLTFPFEEWSHIVKGTGTILLRYRPEVYLPL